MMDEELLQNGNAVEEKPTPEAEAVPVETTDEAAVEVVEEPVTAQEAAVSADEAPAEIFEEPIAEEPQEQKEKKDNFFVRKLKKAFAKKFWFYIPFNVVAIVVGLVCGFTTLYAPILSINTKVLLTNLTDMVQVVQFEDGSASAEQEAFALSYAGEEMNTATLLENLNMGTVVQVALQEVIDQAKMPEVLSITTMDFVHFAQTPSEKILDELTAWIGVDFSAVNWETLESAVIAEVTEETLTGWVQGSMKDDATEEQKQVVSNAMNNVDYKEVSDTVVEMNFASETETATKQQLEELIETNIAEPLKEVPLDAFDVNALVGKEVNLPTGVDTVGDLMDYYKDEIATVLYNELASAADTNGKLPTHAVADMIEAWQGFFNGEGLPGMGGEETASVGAEPMMSAFPGMGGEEINPDNIEGSIESMMSNLQQMLTSGLSLIFLVFSVLFCGMAALWFLLALMCLLRLFKTKKKVLRFWYVKTFCVLPVFIWGLLTVLKSPAVAAFLVENTGLEFFGGMASWTAFLDTGMAPAAIGWIIIWILGFVMIPFNSKLREIEKDKD